MKIARFAVVLPVTIAMMLGLTAQAYAGKTSKTAQSGLAQLTGPVSTPRVFTINRDTRTTPDSFTTIRGPVDAMPLVVAVPGVDDPVDCIGYYDNVRFESKSSPKWLHVNGKTSGYVSIVCHQSTEIYYTIAYGSETQECATAEGDGTFKFTYADGDTLPAYTVDTGACTGKLTKTTGTVVNGRFKAKSMETLPYAIPPQTIQLQIDQVHF